MAESNVVHPIFSSVPEANAAVALSEYFIRSEDFIRSTRGEYAEFPPEPSYILGATIAYRNTDEQGGGISRRFVTLEDPATLAANVGDEFASRYASEVKITKDDLINLGSPVVTKFMNDSMLAPPIQLAHEAELRTLGLFLLAQSVDSERFYHGFVIPRIIYEEMPLLFRQSVLDMIKYLNEQDPESKEDFPEFARAAINDIKQNTENVRGVGFNSVGLHMTGADKIAHIISQQIGMQPTPPMRSGPKLSRQQLRAQRRHGYKT